MFHQGGVQESLAKKINAGGGVHPASQHQPKHSSNMAGRTKAEVQAAMRQVTGAGDFFTQALFETPMTFYLEPCIAV